MLHRINKLFQKEPDQKTSILKRENKANSRGRSMVEMLGVLVIVGVLSIGALKGYNYAMASQFAGTTSNNAKMIAVMVTTDGFMQSMSDGQMRPATDFVTDIKNIQDWQVIKQDGRSFLIRIPNVSETACDILLKYPPTFYEKITLPDHTACQESTVIQYHINTELDTSQCNEKFGCSGCQHCQNGRCADDSTKCNGGVCENGVCQCTDGFVRDKNGLCQSCNSGTFIPESPAECRKCPSRVMYKNLCYSCGAMYWLTTSEEDCAKCPYHTFFGGVEVNAAGEHMGACGFCWVGEEPMSTKSQCDKCSNRYFEGADDTYGKCRICNGTVVCGSAQLHARVKHKKAALSHAPYTNRRFKMCRDLIICEVPMYKRKTARQSVHHFPVHQCGLGCDPTP